MKSKGEFETKMLMGKGSLCYFAIRQIGHINSGLHEISRMYAGNKLILEAEGCPSLWCQTSCEGCLMELKEAC
jgi:hypothetical protein